MSRKINLSWKWNRVVDLQKHRCLHDELVQRIAVCQARAAVFEGEFGMVAGYQTVDADARKFGVDLLITDTVRNQLDNRYSLKKMEPAIVKGKTEPITTYFVEDIIDISSGKL